MSGLRVRKKSGGSVPSAIADMIRAKILQGELISGDRIPETSLSKEFRVGQPSVREALFILEHQGLVRRVPNVGTFVIRLDLRDVTNYHRIRVELEGLAAVMATRHVRKEDLAQLRRFIEQMHDCAVDGDKWQYLHHDLAFHQMVWRLSGNPKLAEVLESIVAPLMVFAFIPVVDLAGFETDAAKAHSKFVDALATGPVEAQHVMEENLRHSLDNYLAHSL